MSEKEKPRCKICSKGLAAVMQCGDSTPLGMCQACGDVFKSMRDWLRRETDYRWPGWRVAYLLEALRELVIKETEGGK